jgi:ABC-type transporter Mla MlaB component
MNSMDAKLSSESGTLTLIMAGRWDSDTTGNWWHRGQQILAQSKPRRLVIDASGVSYCDGAGIAFLVALQQLQARSGCVGDCTRNSGTCSISIAAIKSSAPDEAFRSLNAWVSQRSDRAIVTAS